MHAQDLIREFGVSAGLPDFALNESGMGRLMLDGDFVIDFEHDSTLDILHLYSTVARAPHAGGEAQLRLLMEANLFLERSSGATFALDSSTEEFIACRRLDLEGLDSLALLRLVEQLADAVERLRSDLAALEQLPAPAEALDDRELSPDMLRG
ncbi:MAG: type III secretion system chaperone [Noviherbaspirillum sp.]